MTFDIPVSYTHLDVYKRQEEQYDKAIKEGVQKNITNPVGVFLFKQTFYNNSTDENERCV